MTHEEPESSLPSTTTSQPTDETKLGGPAYPQEVLDKFPELGSYSYAPGSIHWPEVPGLVQMTLATFVPGKGWLTTKRAFIYGGRHGQPPLIEDDVDRIVEIMKHELKSGVIAMKRRLEREA